MQWHNEFWQTSYHVNTTSTTTSVQWLFFQVNLGQLVSLRSSSSNFIGKEPLHTNGAFLWAIRPSYHQIIGVKALKELQKQSTNPNQWLNLIPSSTIRLLTDRKLLSVHQFSGEYHRLCITIILQYHVSWITKIDVPHISGGVFIY